MLRDRMNIHPKTPYRGIVRILVAASLLLFPHMAASSQPILVFMSDFGSRDDSVAVCKGVILGIAPEVRLIDLTHDVVPFSVRDAARFLAGTASFYPEGTIFLVVVDPGVGSNRRPLIVKSQKGQFFVLPDNGVISLVMKQDGIEEVRQITNPSWMIGDALSSTFHGRDLFSPAAAHLVRGDDWTTVGPVVKDPLRLSFATPEWTENGIVGEVIALDGPFGNLITNILADDFRKLEYNYGERIAVQIGERIMKLPFVKTFSDVPGRTPLAYIDSRGRFALAINMGSFADDFKIIPPIPVRVFRKEPRRQK